MCELAAPLQGLNWLAIWPWLDSEQLAILQDQVPDTIRRQMNQAQDQGWVQVVAAGDPDRPRQQLYALTDAGLTALAQHRGLTAPALARAYHLDQAALYAALNRRGLIREIRNLILGLVAHARAAGDEVLAGYTFVRRTFRRGPRQTQRVFAADAYVVYHQQDQLYPFFLLYDCGGLPLESLRDTVAVYLGYRESKEYKGAYHLFPPLVGVLADQERLTELRFRGLGLGHRLHRPAPRLVLTTRAELQAAPTPLGAIWRAGESYDSVHSVPLLRALVEVPVQSPTGHWAPSPVVFIAAAAPADHEKTASIDSAAATAAPPPAPPRAKRILQEPLVERAQDERRQERLRAALQRPAVRQADLEESAALLNASLTPGAQAALDLISHIPFLTVAQVAAICGVVERLIYRHLCQLKEQEAVLEWTTPSQTTATLYYPTALAIYRRARQQGQTLRRAAQQYQHHPVPAQHRLAHPLLLMHTLGVRQFIALVHTAARQVGGQMLTWRDEVECEHRFAVNGQVQQLYPDGWGQMRIGAVVWPFYLEWDHGTRNSADYREKFAIYYDFRAVSISYTLHQEFPAVLVVTTAPDVAQRIRTAVRTIAARRREPALGLRITTAAALERAGFWGEIWWNALENSTPTVPFR